MALAYCMPAYATGLLSRRLQACSAHRPAVALSSTRYVAHLLERLVALPDSGRWIPWPSSPVTPWRDCHSGSIPLRCVAQAFFLFMPIRHCLCPLNDVREFQATLPVSHHDSSSFAVITRLVNLRFTCSSLPFHCGIMPWCGTIRVPRATCGTCSTTQHVTVY